VSFNSTTSEAAIDQIRILLSQYAESDCPSLRKCSLHTQVFVARTFKLNLAQDFPASIFPSEAPTMHTTVKPARSESEHHFELATSSLKRRERFPVHTSSRARIWTKGRFDPERFCKCDCKACIRNISSQKLTSTLGRVFRSQKPLPDSSFDPEHEFVVFLRHARRFALRSRW
jgi:hypothetical protein